MSFKRTFSDWLVALLLVALFALAPATASAKKRHHASKRSVEHSKSSRTKGRGRHSRTSRNWRYHGQQKVDSQRTQEIQDALVRSHYLEGEPSGVWDARTEAALRRYQASNGWQSKVVPDSRALIKLGLGPSDKKLMNPESAMTSRPMPTSANASGPNPGGAQQ